MRDKISKRILRKKVMVDKMTKKGLKGFIDIEWDKEFHPPEWVTRKVKITKEGYWNVVDADLAGSKKDATKLAKEWAKKTKLKFIMG